MPAPQATAMKNLARLKFCSFVLKLPDQWKEPSGDPAADHYGRNYVSSPGVPAPVPPTLFLAANAKKDNCDTAKKISDVIGKYMDGAVDAICSAWSQWQSAATLVGVTIAGPVASVGQVVGPPMGPLILASAPKATPQEMKYSNAIANAINTAWLSYTASIKVPGMPWYPAFAAVPSPVGPPSPNIPCPVIALTQVTASVSMDALKGSMIGLLGDPMAQWHQQLFESIADAFDKCFKIWQVSTMVTNVIGTGPVPSFAPPYVPVGPVVGGVGTMTPGGFA